jgi:hypothetical protein
MAGPAVAGVLSQSGEFVSLLAFVAATVVASSILIVFSARHTHTAPEQPRT